MDPLFPQGDNHAVVDRNELVHFRLANLTKRRGEVAILDHLRPGDKQFEGPEHVAVEPLRDDEREDEKNLYGQHPDAMIAEGKYGKHGKDEMDREKIADELDPETHGCIPYFSKRR
jgi:hypothetical protein